MKKIIQIVVGVVVVGCLLEFAWYEIDVARMGKEVPAKQQAISSGEIVPESTKPAAAPAVQVTPAEVPLAPVEQPAAIRIAPVVKPKAVAADKKSVAGPVAEATAAEPIFPEPVAREALNYVGADPEAEAVWIAAINDNSLSPHDRKNLIEDLNENGFADPDHPTMEELPLIQSRIALIEQLGPNAMDDVNGAAFQEAYKDLLDMQTRLTGR